MRKQMLLMFFVLLINSSCNSQNDKLDGYWEVNFNDPANFPRQILFFSTEEGQLKLTIDEPSHDIYNIPGTNPVFTKEGVYYESNWDIYKYSGKFVSGDSIIKGNRVTFNMYSTPFTMKRIDHEKLSYMIPRVNDRGERVYNYKYSKPPQRNDGLECSTLKVVGIDTTYIYKLVEDILKGDISTIHSLLILKDNKLVLEEYFHNYDYSTLHAIQSATKSFTSALMGIAIDKKLVSSVKEPVWQYFNEWNSTEWIKNKYKIQIEHLLTMTPGLDWKTLVYDSQSDDRQIYNTSDFIGYVLNKNLSNNPGEVFNYNNRLMYLQGHIIEKVSDMPVDSFAKKYLFDELGIRNYQWSKTHTGIIETGGGLYMIPRDMLKLGTLYLNHGKWLGKQIISSEWINSSTENHLIVDNQENINNWYNTYNWYMAYGYNWWLKKYLVDNQVFYTYFASGHGEQYIIVIPAVNVVFVMTAGNHYNATQRQDEIMTKYILPSINTINSQDKPAIDRKELVGEYKIAENSIAKIELQDSNLVAINPTGTSTRIIPQSSDIYTTEDLLEKAKFLKNDEGVIIGVEVYQNGVKVYEAVKID